MCTLNNYRLEMRWVSILGCRDHVQSPNYVQIRAQLPNRLHVLSHVARNDSLNYSNPNLGTMYSHFWNIRAYKCHQRNYVVANQHTLNPECHPQISNRWINELNRNLCGYILWRRPQANSEHPIFRGPYCNVLHRHEHELVQNERLFSLSQNPFHGNLLDPVTI